VAEALLARGADDAARDGVGYTPLDWARYVTSQGVVASFRRRGHAQVVKALLR
jgi:ankyrin repeat protein